jgi:uncharacterized protein involved in exopolysaccharide biosynthesis
MKVERADEEIPIGGYLEIFRRHGLKIAALSLATGIITLLVVLRMPNQYVSSATIVPVVEEQKPSFVLGAIASSIGLSVGPSKIEDLEALLKSRDITIRVFRNHKLWPLLYPDRFDPNTGQLKIGWWDRLTGERAVEKTPGEWDAVRATEKRLRVSVSRKMGTISVAFESRSAQGSREIVSYYLEEAKDRLQEKAIEKATRNKRFLEEQIGRTVDPIIRERLHTLYTQEFEREMLARNREQFGFTVLDFPLAPDRKSGPARARSAVLATVLSFFFWMVLFHYLGKRRGPRPEVNGSR